MARDANTRYEYTSKLQQMFTDITLSAELNSKYSQTELGRADARRFKVVVLQVRKRLAPFP